MTNYPKFSAYKSCCPGMYPIGHLTTDHEPLLLMCKISALIQWLLTVDNSTIQQNTIV